MNYIKENKIYIFLIYINLIFVFTLIKTCYKIQGFNYLYITYLFLVGFLFYWLLNSVFKKGIIKVLCAAISVGASLLLYLTNSNFINEIIWNKIVNKIIYINNLIASGMPTSFSDYKTIFLITIPAIVFILLFLTKRSLPNSVLIFNLSSIITLWYFGYTEEIKEYLFYFILISLLTYCINSLLINIKKLSKKGIKVGIDRWKIVLYTVIASFLIAGATNYLPQDYRGKYASEIRSKFYNKFARQEETGEEKGKKLQYDLSYSGYDNNKKKLGGPVSINKLIAFRVQSEGKYYLKGTAKDLYDGFSWDQSDKKYSPWDDNKTDIFENDFYVKSYLGDVTNMIVFPEELNTTTIFSPNLFNSVKLENGEVYYDQFPNLINSFNITKPYLVYFNNLNVRGQSILNLGNEKGVREMGVYSFHKNFEKYLQLPANISPRVYELVYTIVKDKETNFDKVNAIRNYLRKNFPYTLEVSKIPEDQEFLDYFLFTEKKGYCTYFATAETIMCRIAGIPARYVEGFNMSGEKDDEGKYIVRNENAHAWSEVLYMNNSGLGLWYTVDAVPDAVDTIHKLEEQKKNQSQTSNPNLNSNLGTRPNKNLENFEETGGQYSNRFVIPPIVLKVMYIITIIVFINLLLIIYDAININRLLKKQSIIPVYKYSLQRLESIDIKCSEFMGELEFTKKLPIDIRERVKSAAELAYSEYFGRKVPSEFNKKQYYEDINNYIKKKQTRLDYFVKKYYFITKIAFIKSQIVLLYKKIIE